MGLTLGIVAAPCLGPFVLGLITYVGQKGDALLGFLYFFVLSIGLGLPLSLLAVFSGALERLPLSGPWMVWVKKAFGWILVGMAAYLFHPVTSPLLDSFILYSAVMVATAIHLGWAFNQGPTTRVFGFATKSLAGLLILCAVFFLYTGFKQEKGIEWIPYGPAVMDEAKKANIPVLMDFYADWCAPCVAMEKNVFTNPEVVRLSKNFVSVRVDLTKNQSYHEALLNRYRIKGVPTILIINGKGVEEKALRIESYVGKDEVLSRMRQLK
jgi:thiol:disulfide interchange protein DsbD